MPDLSTALSYRSPARIRMDVRTSLLALIVVNVIGLSAGFTGPALAARMLATLIPMVFLLAQRRWIPAALCLVATGFALATQTIGVDWLVVRTPHTASGYALAVGAFLVGTVANLVARMLPCILMAWCIITTTRVSTLMGSLARLRVPAGLVIPLAVVLRMVPVLASESSAIADSARSRGLRVGVSRPGALITYRIVPLTLRTVDIGDELTQAALTRGLDAATARTCLFRIGFGWADGVLITVSVVAAALFTVSLW